MATSPILQRTPLSFESVLIANRGEIAVRLIIACQELGIRAIAVYSDADRDAPHVRLADAAYRIGPPPARESYLNIAAIIAAAQTSGAQAIHPGYGFLSENADFAEACASAGIVFIGPPPEAIRKMGSKTAAKRAVEAVGVPTVPGYMGAARDLRTLQREAARVGYPILLKATAGGGGMGQRAVERPEDFAEALASAQREALASFGDEAVFFEKLIVAPRHVEFQILADAHGHTIHLGERECSIQRRRQKVIEESPCVALTPELRAEMGEAAVRAAQAVGYVNAGTCEFLLADDGRYYFLEMNTRLQVEHPITEQVTGVDLVHLQLAIAAGRPLELAQSEISPRGHAIEARLYAEDPAQGYLPSSGRILVFAPPRAPGVRVDAGVSAGGEVSMNYDPMLAKLI
ncbi:MAG TPA: biotin carboxylase N-terminal domain-containing protein, partial [Ktedonobacterales bacterium]|nr:biotin carboxylase N-terminal domain-containing protein [Ktedonobacterales bacterium]